MMVAQIFNLIPLYLRFVDPRAPVELYALASRYPFAANSRWCEEVAGQHIATVAATAFAIAAIASAPGHAPRAIVRVSGARTLEVMRAFGASVAWTADDRLRVEAGRHYQPRDYTIEPDASSAAYPFCAAAIAGGRVHGRRPPRPIFGYFAK